MLGARRQADVDPLSHDNHLLLIYYVISVTLPEAESVIFVITC